VLNDGFGNIETCVDIENISATRFNDIIRGNAGGNYIEGTDGLDTMSGGGGSDGFGWYDLAHFNDGDVITDFSAADDVLSFDRAAFPNMNAVLIENDLVASTTGGTFLFNPATGILYYDSNGSTAGGVFTVVRLPGVTALTANNFDLY
jgi:Ca2+-binding RTX toxin-like protein